MKIEDIRTNILQAYGISRDPFKFRDQEIREKILKIYGFNQNQFELYHKFFSNFNCKFKVDSQGFLNLKVVLQRKAEGFEDLQWQLEDKLDIYFGKVKRVTSLSSKIKTIYYKNGTLETSLCYPYYLLRLKNNKNVDINIYNP